MKCKKEIKNFKGNPDNIFHHCKTEKELIKYYKSYIKEGGTDYLINSQFTERLQELDMIQNAIGYSSKDLLERRSNQVDMDSFNL